MVVTLVNGAKQFVTSKVNRYGAAVITISKSPQTFITIQEYIEFQKRRNIDYDDYRAILADCRTVRLGWSAANRHRQGRLRHKLHHRYQHPRLDVDHAAAFKSRSRAWPLFTEIEDTHSTHVAIVGSDIADNLLGAGDPLGKEIRVDGIPLHRDRGR